MSKKSNNSSNRSATNKNNKGVSGRRSQPRPAVRARKVIAITAVTDYSFHLTRSRRVRRRLWTWFQSVLLEEITTRTMLARAMSKQKLRCLMITIVTYTASAVSTDKCWAHDKRKG